MEAGLAVVAIAISAVVAGVQLIRFLKEHNQSNRMAAAEKTKAVAERDQIAVKTAEGALLVMERMLAVTQASEQELRDQVARLRQQLDGLEAQLREAHTRIRRLEAGGHA